MSFLVSCNHCGKQYSMRPERAGQKLPCRNCGAMMTVPGGSLISPGMAILGGAGIGLVMLIVGIASTYSSRSRMQPTPVIANSNPAPLFPEQSEADQASSRVPSGPEGSPQASFPEPAPPNRNPASGFDDQTPAVGMMPPIPMDPKALELYEEHRRRLAGQGIFLPENPASMTDGVDDPGNEDVAGQGMAASGNGREAGGQPPMDRGPGFVPENSKIRGQVTEWKPCVDPMPADFLPVWEPAKPNRQTVDESGRVDMALAGSGSPFIAVETEVFSDEWTVFDLRSKRPIGLAYAGRGFSSQRVLRRDGKYFATEYEQGVRVSDVREKQILGTFQGGRGIEGKIGFVGTDRIAICGDRELLVWTIPKGQLVQQVTLPEARSRQIAYSGGGKYAAILGNEHGSRVVRMIDLTTGDDAGVLVGHRGDSWSGSHAVAFSDDGLELAAVMDGRMMVWDLQTGEVIEDFELGSDTSERHGSNSGRLEWFPNKQRWLLNSSVVIDRSTRSVWFRLEENGVWVVPAAVASDNHIIALTTDGRSRSIAVADLKEPPFSGSEAEGENVLTLASAFALPLVKTADWSSVQTLEPALETPAWQVKPDPAVLPAEPLQSEIGIPLREDRLNDLRFAGVSSGAVALSYEVQSSGSRARRDPSKCRVEVFSLAHGRRMSQLKLLDPAKLMALSPSGNRVLMQNDRNSDRVDVWDLEKKSHVAGWKPDDSRHSSRSAAAIFVDDSHVLTLVEKKLVMWELPTCRAIYQIENAGGPGVSPTGKYLAVRSGNVYVMLEALTGDIVGRLTTDDEITAASFHPNGHLFAAVTQVGGYFDTKFADLVVWDLKNGERVAHVPLQYAGSTMHWCGDRHVLIDNTILVDVVNQVPAWTYSIRHGLHCMLSPDDQHWYLTRPDRAGRSELKLRSVRLPEPEVITRTADKVGADLIAMKPGTEVAYSFDANHGPVSLDTEKAILDKVRLELIRNGMVPVEKSRFRVLISMEERTTEEQVAIVDSPGFPGLGGGFGGFPRIPPRFGGPFGQPPAAPSQPIQTIQKQEVECTVRLTDDGRTIWRSSRVYDNPFSFEVKQGQSIPDAVRDKLWKSAIQYFTNLRLPKYVYRANEGFGYGETALTYDGPLTLGGDPILPNEQRGYEVIPDLDLWRSILGQ